MIRLIKFAAYAAMGYAFYELFAVLTGSTRRRIESRNLNRALNSIGGRLQTLTGPGVGQREATLDRDGAMVPHQVGRGAVAH